MNIDLKKIYDASIDGFDSKSFHNKCDNKGATLCIIKNDYNYIFGGYTKVPWKRKGGSKYDNTAFLFGIKPKMFISKIKNDQHKIAVTHSKNYSINFGCRGDIALKNECNNNDNYSWIYSYQYINKLVSNNQINNKIIYFKVLNYEVYKVL